RFGSPGWSGHHREGSRTPVCRLLVSSPVVSLVLFPEHIRPVPGWIPHGESQLARCRARRIRGNEGHRVPVSREAPAVPWHLQATLATALLGESADGSCWSGQDSRDQRKSHEANR